MLGLRVSEDCAIDIKDLGTDPGTGPSLSSERAPNCLLPLRPGLGPEPLDLAAGERLLGPLLLSQAGTRLNRHAASRIVTRLARAAGITEHFAALPAPPLHTAALNAGVALRDVQTAARHSDPGTTTRYDRAKTTWIATPATSSRPSRLGAG